MEGTDLDAGPLEPNAIRGCILTTIELGIRLLRSSDPSDSALWLHRLAVRHGERRPKIDKPVYAQRRKPATPALTAEAVLASVPGISAGLARELLARFGSLRAVLDATPEEWATVRGIGPRRAAALGDVFAAVPGPLLTDGAGRATCPEGSNAVR